MIKKIKKLRSKLQVIDKEELPPGIVEAPQNIPENESGNLKIITE